MVSTGLFLCAIWTLSAPSTASNMEQVASLSMSLLRGQAISASPSAAPGTMLLGKLGQALAPSPILAEPKKGARVLYTLKKFDYIVVPEEVKGEWATVLLDNGSRGYVEAQMVAVLPAEVTGPDNQQPHGAVARAYSSVGVPYKDGGRDLKHGVGNGEFVQLIFAELGTNLPAEPRKQARVGEPVVRLEDLQPGDRVYFWVKKANRIGEAGIVMGNGYYINASPRAKKVAVEYLGDRLDVLVAARR